MFKNIIGQAVYMITVIIIILVVGEYFIPEDCYEYFVPSKNKKVYPIL